MTKRKQSKGYYAALLLCCALVNVCNVTWAVPHDGSQHDRYASDVIGVKEMHLSSEYWIKNTVHAGRVLKEPAAIKSLNSATYATDRNMVDLEHYSGQLPGQTVRDMILAISKPYSDELFYLPVDRSLVDQVQGDRLEQGDYKTYTENLGLESLAEPVDVRFALVVRRSDMRRYPTDDRVYSTQETMDLDRFQENGLFPGDAVVVLHQSRDTEWFFVQSYNYAAWVRRENVAIGDRAEILAYIGAPRFLVITDDKVMTSYSPVAPAVSEVQLDMGVRIPLADPDRKQNNVNGQNPFASHIVLLPVRDQQGELKIQQALIARSKGVHRGYLPYTRENIVRQAFKFLGERYGWGHSNNARDCTGFVAEIYKTVGIHLPRNSGQQGKSSIGENVRFTPDNTPKDKLRAIESLQAGDLIYVPGHVMMFLGNAEGEPYVIHDVSELIYRDGEGGYYEGVLNGVSVTPLIPLFHKRDITYVDDMYSIKKIK